MQFHRSDVLSVVTGRLLSRNGVRGTVALLDYMTGTGIYTHQIPRALDTCRPALLAQHPALVGIPEPNWDGDVDQETINLWVDQFEPEYYDITTLDNWGQRDPATELAEIAGIERVIVFDPNDPNNQRN